MRRWTEPPRRQAKRRVERRYQFSKKSLFRNTGHRLAQGILISISDEIILKHGGTKEHRDRISSHTPLRPLCLCVSSPSPPSQGHVSGSSSSSINRRRSRQKLAIQGGLVIVFSLHRISVIQVFLWVARSVFYSMSLPLALCQWRHNLKLQVRKMRYHGLLAPARLPASWCEDEPGQEVSWILSFSSRKSWPHRREAGWWP